jgi:hypothetical protein
VAPFFYRVGKKESSQNPRENGREQIMGAINFFTCCLAIHPDFFFMLIDFFFSGLHIYRAREGQAEGQKNSSIA